MITLLTHISNAPLFGNVVGLVLLARRVARAIGITGTLLLGAVADTQKHASRHQDPRVIARVPSHGPASLTGGAALTGGFVCLTQSSRGLADVIIENGPWRVVVDRYDREHTLHYLDPPYWQQEGYGFDFPWSEYEAIADFMRVAKGKVVLSINDHPEIRELFEGMNIIPLQLRYSISRTKENNTPSGELIIKSWADTQAQLL
ncbi:DNA adenine methylase [Xylella fastidiosa subsp. multiplex]|uniref:DNA adenine methylase n=1 Tax=Xylella fastidiosa subsp. multiplex TaxID=644357 RepID=A0A9Q4MKU6_XYLFS|nr:DNA adenine methylase [Xylella fastidiosa]MBE0269389.1 DNA adenine methylase [Xylella fastidiosa subsp. multiplex]MBE0275986.1 DNA adenine methylase [Xylella fastidiosa subsp. multiplex]MBE0277174.1 DNA adenine methylase [Xylella fastidiosa subsp. multiplex]MBE0282654.1 DNA adenine methylase [Xylella fastidiosa subsp. multiplex]MRT53923.1 DNA adenine methylase [Xylella fastidiosa subsp. multiplex]